MKKTLTFKNRKLERLNCRMIIISLFFVLGILSGCTGQDKTFDWKKPVSLDMNAPEGPINYRQGWSDGCNSGMASTVNSFHQFIGSYRFKLDEKLRYDKLYNKAWKYGYNHCGYSMKSLAQYNF